MSKFKFPSPPRLTRSVELRSHRICRAPSSWSDDEDCSLNESCWLRHKMTACLPPIGIFWDIENCQVPKQKSASSIVQRMRDLFVQNYREAEFQVVCDVRREHPHIVNELHDSQVNLIHVSSVSKNAADEKLRQSMRRFAELHPSPCAVLLISGDVNFAADLSDLRYRKKIHVILVHNTNAADALILCANEHHQYRDLIDDLPVVVRKDKVHPDEMAILVVDNLPTSQDSAKIKTRLKLLTDNCGGKIEEIRPEGKAVIRFTTLSSATRAQKRINGEDVFGNKIRASTPALRDHSGRKVKPEQPKFSGADSAWKLRSSFTQPPPRFNLPAVGGSNSSWRQESSFFRPIQNPSIDLNQNLQQDSELSDDSRQSNKQLVDLVISNLDSSIGMGKLKWILTDLLKEHIAIHSVKMVTQVDGSINANVKVYSQQEAQYAISQLHHAKLGQKRIVISYAQTSPTTDPEHLKAMTIDILQNVPERSMLLSKFMMIMQSRYQCTPTLSEINKLKDICKVLEEQNCRVISLTQDAARNSPHFLNKVIVSYCTIHCPNGIQSADWCDVDSFQPPNVRISLKFFAERLYQLIEYHSNSLPVISFQFCYESVFGSALPIDETGVPLEHLVLRVPNVLINFSGPNRNVKILQVESRSAEDAEDAFLKGVPPSLASNISLFCREVVDLFRNVDRCQLPLAKFIPTYHHHFGRQCRIADYGYTKLIDLLESLSHVVQIIGAGDRKYITLSHLAQTRRFTNDLLKVLRMQPYKQIAVHEFPAAYEKILNKSFNPVDYGLCNFEDLLEEIPKNTVVVTSSSGQTMIALPKREQTAKEVAKTKEFSTEVIEVLRHSPYCTMAFHKFVPTYHQVFGHQCKVSDYGFVKLVELFEAIPDVVKMNELPDGGKAVSLTLPKMLDVLESQLLFLMKMSNISTVRVNQLPELYSRLFGYPFKPQAYACESIEQVLAELSHHITARAGDDEDGDAALRISFPYRTIRRAIDETLKIRVWTLLLEPPHCVESAVLRRCFREKFDGAEFVANDVSKLVNEDVLELEGGYVSLTGAYVLATEVYRCLYSHHGQVSYSTLERFMLSQQEETLISLKAAMEDYEIFTAEDLVDRFGFLIVLSDDRHSIKFNYPLLADYLPLPHLEEVSNVKTPPKSLWHTPVKSLASHLPEFQTPRMTASDVMGLIMTPPFQATPGHVDNPWLRIKDIFPYRSSPNADQVPPPPLKLMAKSGDKTNSDSSLDSKDSGVIDHSDVRSPYKLFDSKRPSSFLEFMKDKSSN